MHGFLFTVETSENFIITRGIKRYKMIYVTKKVLLIGQNNIR